MIRSLRARLALSHTLPILLLMPVLSLYLVYSLEGFLARNLLQQLSYQARLLTDQAQQNEGIMESAQAAQDFLARASGLTDAHVLLLSRDGTLLASTHVELCAGRIVTIRHVLSVTDDICHPMSYNLFPLQKSCPLGSRATSTHLYTRNCNPHHIRGVASEYLPGRNGPLNEKATAHIGSALGQLSFDHSTFPTLSMRVSFCPMSCVSHSLSSWVCRGSDRTTRWPSGQSGVS
jgi:hypothetical protein